MGLLDDAIREHLDLKRARGGDPADIERMEREALGPVRREPTIGSARPDALDERGPIPPDAEFEEDPLVDLEDLQEHGYNDSTAPHPHPHHETHHAPAEEHFGLEHDAAFEAEAEQPRRRFLRRNRQSPETVSPEPAGYPDDDFDPLAHPPLEQHDPLAHAELPFDPLAHTELPTEHHDALADTGPPTEHHDALAHTEPPTEHHDALAHTEPPTEHHDALAHTELPNEHGPLGLDEPSTDNDVTGPPASGTPAVPPHLQFDQPPKRPRFSAEPPQLQHDELGVEQEDQTEAQETTEFDVQKHIAETRHHPDEVPSRPAAQSVTGDAIPAQPSEQPAPPQAAPAQSAPTQPATVQPEEDEDVLEETPEFLQDTPEHDRLWFEQRPPKDFDFDG